MASIWSWAHDLAMGSSLIVRPARVQDAGQMARVQVRCWQETYRGLMPDAVLDDPGLPAARPRHRRRAGVAGGRHRPRMARGVQSTMAPAPLAFCNRRLRRRDPGSVSQLQDRS